MSPTFGPKAWAGLGVGIVLASGALFVFWPKEPPPARREATLSANLSGVTLSEDAPQWQYVQLAVAEEGPPLPSVPAPGRVDFDEKRTANVGTPLAGKVDQVLVRMGDEVKTGDRLFSVRSGAFADLNREYQAAREEVVVKSRVRDRTRELLALKIAPEKEALAADAELKEAELALKAAGAKESSLQVQEVGENLFWVRAPRAGTVVDLDVFANQQASPERERPLLRISDLGEVRVLADLPESDAADLHAGQGVKIRTPSGAERDATVDRVSAVMDPLRRTVEVRIRADNSDRRLRPNGFVDILLQPDPTLRRVRVPAEAVVSEGNRSVVFVSRQGGRLERIPVKVGQQREGQVEVRAGLEPGTRYVAKGALLLLNQIDLAN